MQRRQGAETQRTATDRNGGKATDRRHRMSGQIDTDEHRWEWRRKTKRKTKFLQEETERTETGKEPFESRCEIVTGPTLGCHSVRAGYMREVAGCSQQNLCPPGGRRTGGFWDEPCATKIRPGIWQPDDHHFRFRAEASWLKKIMNGMDENHARHVAREPGATYRFGYGPQNREKSAGHGPVKPGYYLMRLRLQYAQKGARPLARILSHNCNIPAPPM